MFISFLYKFHIIKRRLTEGLVLEISLLIEALLTANTRKRASASRELGNVLEI